MVTRSFAKRRSLRRHLALRILLPLPDQGAAFHASVPELVHQNVRLHQGDDRLLRAHRSRCSLKASVPIRTEFFAKKRPFYDRSATPKAASF
jgi:hypothetical protein